MPPLVGASGLRPQPGAGAGAVLGRGPGSGGELHPGYWPGHGLECELESGWESEAGWRLRPESGRPC